MVNDDEIGQQAQQASSLPNGLMLNEYVDIEGEKRQAFYFGQDSKPLPNQCKTSLLGKRHQRDFDVIKS